ncbi:MAG: type II toxin-antitoxin system RelE/ParE family toxin [Flavobacteriales bacterium]|jgi:toxin ParE1/3/4
MRFRLSKLAEEDLELIWLYTLTHWSKEQADRYLKLIFDEIAYLSQHPLSGRDYSEFREGYRCSKVKSHLIFYKLYPTGNDILIVRILHGSMDISHTPFE